MIRNFPISYITTAHSVLVVMYTWTFISMNVYACQQMWNSILWIQAAGQWRNYHGETFCGCGEVAHPKTVSFFVSYIHCIVCSLLNIHKSFATYEEAWESCRRYIHLTRSLWAAEGSEGAWYLRCLLVPSQLQLINNIKKVKSYYWKQSICNTMYSVSGQIRRYCMILICYFLLGIFWCF